MFQEARQKFRTYAPTIAFGVVLFALLTNIDMTLAIYDKLCCVLNPLVIGVSIALVLNVPMRGIERLFRRFDRKNKFSEKARQVCSFCLVLVLTPLALGGIIAFFVPQFVSAVTNLITIVRDNSEDIVNFTNRFGIDANFVQQRIDSAITWITDNMTNIAGVTFSTLVSIVNSVTSGVMSVMLALYMLLSKRQLVRQCKRLSSALLPRRLSAFVVRVTRMFVDSFSVFLSRQCLEALILGIILFVSMTIFAIPYTMSICCLSVVLALIPYVGSMLSLALGALMIVLVSPSKALIFVITFLVVQQIEENLIYPRVVGESLGLPAYVTLLAVAIGGEVMGIIGMLVFVPITNVIYTLARELVAHRLGDEK